MKEFDILSVSVREFLKYNSDKENDCIKLPLNGDWFREGGSLLNDICFDLAKDETKIVEVSFVSGETPFVQVSYRKKKRYKRIYTSGCFDIFHYGHLNILQQSKEMCDELIVGVSTDELIEREKGRRPVIPFEERSKIVASIKCVDRVIAQEDKDKQKIVDLYSIEAITVGDDWKGKYPSVSCEMVYFPYTPSVSSTILKQRLKL